MAEDEATAWIAMATLVSTDGTRYTLVLAENTSLAEAHKHLAIAVSPASSDNLPPGEEIVRVSYTVVRKSYAEALKEHAEGKADGRPTH